LKREAAVARASSGATPSPVLYLREELVAKGSDGLVEGAGDVGDAGRRSKHEETPQEADGGADLTAVGGLLRRRAEVAAEELVGAIYQMDLHPSPPATTRWMPVRSRASSCPSRGSAET